MRLLIHHASLFVPNLVLLFRTAQKALRGIVEVNTRHTIAREAVAYSLSPKYA
jgi:hypothetical protein